MKLKTNPSLFLDRVSPCNSSHYVDHAGLKPSSTSASQVLELRACAITTWLNLKKKKLLNPQIQRSITPHQKNSFFSFCSRDYYREPQLVKIHNIIDSGLLNPNWVIYHATSPPKVQKNTEERGMERLYVRPRERGFCCEIVSSRHDREAEPVKLQQYGWPNRTSVVRTELTMPV